MKTLTNNNPLIPLQQSKVSVMNTPDRAFMSLVSLFQL